MKPILSVEHLGKKYSLKSGSGNVRSYNTLSETLISLPKNILKAARPAPNQEFWALDDISFKINPGERVGIIGRNGAGKSTLLKILSRITPPSKGEVRLTGRLSSLLEVGTGFHPELSGRENIFLNGAILGMKRGEIKKKFDSIIDFSGVEKFIDTPVKRYSSGMYVRLAFAVAANLDPDILIVDEVLAVGDADFQKKCLGKMEEVSKNEGRTILIVSHNMTAIRNLCDRSIWIDKGLIKQDGPTLNTIGDYLKQNSFSGWTRDLSQVSRYGSGEARGTFVALNSYSPQGIRRNNLICSGDDFEILLTLKSYSSLNNVNIACIIYDIEGTRLIDANLSMLGKLASLQKDHESKFQWVFRKLLLTPGQYLISFWLGQPNKDIDGIPEVLSITVTEPDHTPYLNQYPGKYRCDFSLDHKGS